MYCCKRFGLLPSIVLLLVGLLHAQKTADLSQQVIQRVGKIDLNNYRLDTLINNNESISGTRKVSRKQAKAKVGNLREVEWEINNPLPAKNATQSRQIRDKPLRLLNSPALRLLGEQKCHYCVPSRHLQHYHLMNCTASYSRECNCPMYFRCPRAQSIPETKLSSLDFCEHNGRRYEIGDMIQMEHLPCKVCRCGRSNDPKKFGVAEIDCSVFIECPEMVFGLQPSSDQCYFAYTHDSCCGLEFCPDKLNITDKRRQIQCHYESKVYRYGQKIYSEQNPCLHCICDEHWNNYDPESSKSCRRIQCPSLREKESQGCTPIYSQQGCCPIDYVCERKQSEPSLTLINTHTCMFDGKQFHLNQRVTFNKQSTLYQNVCANCTCLVPPLLTCHGESRCVVDYGSLSL